MRFGRISFVLVFSWMYFLVPRYVESMVVQEEVDIINDMAATLGSNFLKFNKESCSFEIDNVGFTKPHDANSTVECQCFNGTDCHVVKIILKRFSLPGVLPPQISKLPYLKYIDFAYNYLSGSIPPEWLSMQLVSISLLVNRLSGNIPKNLGMMTSLVYLNLEANQFSGFVPPELGNLANLESLIISSNFLTGELPTSLGSLKNLTDFRINDNKFSGSIPNYFQKWGNLQRLEMHASGLRGPIPSNISHLSNLNKLRISDLDGPNQEFPDLKKMDKLEILILRSCNLFGGIPSYLLQLVSLRLLDVSFNNLTGEIPSHVDARHQKFIFLTGNALSGYIPDSILMPGSSVDLSYNNFTVHENDSVCKQSQDLNINLYRGTNFWNSSDGAIDPCLKTDTCPRYASCFHVNTGGPDVIVNNTRYIRDGDVEGVEAKLFVGDNLEWGFSTTGDFMDDNRTKNTRNMIQSESPSLPSIYSTARVAPITLSYFHRCLENGKYTVTLHFAELQFTNDATYNSLGRRFFDIYVQGKLVEKDFSIFNNSSAQQPIKFNILDVVVTNNFLEVRLYFAGKGTTRIPNRGDYGPIISALSIVSDSRGCENSSSSPSSKKYHIISGLVGFLFSLIFL